MNASLWLRMHIIGWSLQSLGHPGGQECQDLSYHFSFIVFFLTMFCHISIHININYVFKSKQLTDCNSNTRHSPVREFCRRSVVTKAVTIRASDGKLWCDKQSSKKWWCISAQYIIYCILDMAVLSVVHIKTRNCLSDLQVVLSLTNINSRLTYPI